MPYRVEISSAEEILPCDRLRKYVRAGLIGEASHPTYHVTRLGEGGAALRAVLDGSSDFAKVLEAAERPMIVLGAGALARPDGAAVLAACWQIADRYGLFRGGWHGFNVLHRAAARVGALDIGFLPGEGGKDLAGMMGGGVDLLWLLGADEFDTGRIGADTFVVYQGHHGDRGAARADVILPGAAYTEKDGLYVNTEGRVQEGRLGVFPPGEAREDWKILRALSEREDPGAVAKLLEIARQGETPQLRIEAIRRFVGRGGSAVI